MNGQDDAGISVLCRCLASVSMADGELDSREIATMLTMVEQVTGASVSADDLVSAAVDVSEDRQAFEASLLSIADEIESEFKLLILKTCIVVGRADDTMISYEQTHIYRIGKLLGFSDAEIARQFDIIT